MPKNTSHRIKQLCKKDIDSKKIFQEEYYEKKYEHPLFFAVKKVKSFPVLKTVIHEFADEINIKNKNEHTPLMVASMKGNKEIVELLIKLGADLDSQDLEGNTALMHAVKNWDKVPNVAHLLLYHSANPNIKNYYGMSPLMIAAKYCHNEIGVFIVDSLLTYGAKINDICPVDETPLMMAAMNATTTSHNKIVKKLLSDDQIDIDAQNASGQTAFMLATMKSGISSDLKTLKLLLKAGSNINHQDIDGRTALIHAVRRTGSISNDETVKFLLENGARVNLQDKNGWSALMHAAAYSSNLSNANTVKILLEYGADLHLCNKEGKNAIAIAYLNANLDSNFESLHHLLTHHLSKDIHRISHMIEEYKEGIEKN